MGVLMYMIIVALMALVLSNPEETGIESVAPIKSQNKKKGTEKEHSSKCSIGHCLSSPESFGALSQQSSRNILSLDSRQDCIFHIFLLNQDISEKTQVTL